MSFLEVVMVQVREVIRRWQAEENKAAIGRASALSRRTVGRYIEAAQSLGVVQGGEPPDEEVLAQLLQRNHAGPLPYAGGPAASVSSSLRTCSPVRVVVAAIRLTTTSWLPPEAADVEALTSQEDDQL